MKKFIIIGDYRKVIRATSAKAARRIADRLFPRPKQSTIVGPIG